MGAYFHGKYGHRSAAACDQYERWEQEQVGFKEGPELWAGSGARLMHLTPEQVKNLGQGKNLDGSRQLRRPHPRQKEGEGLSFTIPYSVTQAMTAAGLMNDPKVPFSIIEPSAMEGFKDLNRHAYGRTTDGKLVKVNLLAVAYRGYATRAGQVSPELKLFVLNMGRTEDGRFLAVYWPPLFRAQKSAQAVFHMGVAYKLGRDARIKCVPHRHAFRALGVDPRKKPLRSRQIRRRTRRMGQRGPRARARAARETRGKKQKVSWADAVKNTATHVKGEFLRDVEKLSKQRQRKFARKCVTAAIRYCARNSKEFTRQDVFAAAAQLALPHVHPKVLAAVLRRELARHESHGITAAKEFPDGHVVYTSVGHKIADKKAIAFLAAETRRLSGGMQPKELVKALAARGYSTRTLARVKALTQTGGVTFDKKHRLADKETLRALVEAYRKTDRQVVLVGRSLGKNAYSASELGDALTRTGHFTALWRGLRSSGSLMQRLKVAEHIRETTSARLKKGAVVIAEQGNARELQKIAAEVRKAGGKLIVTGRAARELSPKVDRHLHELTRGRSR